MEMAPDETDTMADPAKIFRAVIIVNLTLSGLALGLEFAFPIIIDASNPISVETVSALRGLENTNLDIVLCTMGLSLGVAWLVSHVLAYCFWKHSRTCYLLLCLLTVVLWPSLVYCVTYPEYKEIFSPDPLTNVLGFIIIFLMGVILALMWFPSISERLDRKAGASRKNASRYPLRGKKVKYIVPFESVCEARASSKLFEDREIDRSTFDRCSHNTYAREILESFVCGECGRVFVGIPDCHVLFIDPNDLTKTMQYNIASGVKCPTCNNHIQGKGARTRPAVIDDLLATQWAGLFQPRGS